MAKEAQGEVFRGVEDHGYHFSPRFVLGEQKLHIGGFMKGKAFIKRVGEIRPENRWVWGWEIKIYLGSELFAEDIMPSWAAALDTARYYLALISGELPLEWPTDLSDISELSRWRPFDLS